ncbi:MAG: hypothetical protein FJ388_26005 [Verrucomicrobia bacterium]|nr:hypothetical protein [Verrucomicrobiota bacterium]
MDYELWLRLARKYPPHFIDRYLACFRIHPGSITGSGRLHELWRRERWDVSQKYEPCSRMTARFQHAMASGGKLLARWWRTLTGPRETSLYCVPRVVVLTDRLAPGWVNVFNALQERHDLEAQVWTAAVTEELQMNISHRMLSGSTRQIMTDLWRERPSVVVIMNAPFRIRILATLYSALARAKLVVWNEAAPQTAEEFCRALRRD